MDQLPTEAKVLIVNGRTLVEETRKLVKEQGWEVDLTCKLQLRDDCAAIEKLIKKIQKGNYRQKDLEGLKLAIVRLQTTSDGILRTK